jgi:hypothetical protein
MLGVVAERGRDLGIGLVESNYSMSLGEGKGEFSYQAFKVHGDMLRPL